MDQERTKSSFILRHSSSCRNSNPSRVESTVTRMELLSSHTPGCLRLALRYKKKLRKQSHRTQLKGCRTYQKATGNTKPKSHQSQKAAKAKKLQKPKSRTGQKATEAKKPQKPRSRRKAGKAEKQEKQRSIK